MKYLSFFLALFLLLSCNNEPLPVLGNPGHKITDFQFINQDSMIVTNATLEDKIYISDFFFISCPTICPKVKKQMLRIYDRYENEEDLVFLSHTIDPKRDTVGALKTYASNLEVNAAKWHFVTGEKSKLYAIADDYFSIAIEDPNVPGGFDHSGKLLLIDKDGQIRSFCEGTEEESVTNFFKDIDRLLDEHKAKS
jgi:protein SCO1/2